MTLQEFKNLPATRKGLKKLESTENIFFNEVSRELRTYLQLPSSVKKIVPKFSFEKVYEKYVSIKNLGYRKELIMPS